MYEFIKESNKSRLSYIAINYFDNIITYEQLFHNVEKVASGLVSQGISRGDIVSIVSLNTPETIYLIYALSHIGAIANLIIATSTREDIIEQVHNTNSKVIFILDKIIERIESEKKIELDIPVVLLSLSQSAKGVNKFILNISKKNTDYILFNDFVKEQSFIHACNDSNAPAIIVYTSGSTGTPKGVVLSNRNLNSVAVMCSLSGKNYKPKEKFLCILPPFYSFGIGMTHLCFYTGMTEIIQLIPKVKPIIRMLKKHRPERFVIGPAITDVIEKNPTKDFSYCIDLTGGGGAITLDKEEKLNSILVSKKSGSLYLSGYGMTELASAVSMNHNDRHKTQSIGLPLSMVNIRINDIENGHELKYNEEGEILVSSPGLMLEYFKNDEATSEAIEIINGERWIHTGDIGRVDPEGYVFVTGRLKRIYIVTDDSGMAYKLFPQRMEEVIESIEDVKRCAVVVLPDECKQSTSVVFVQVSGNVLQEKDIDRYIKKALPEYYWPKKIVLLKEIPMNQNQKIDYKELEKLAHKM